MITNQYSCEEHADQIYIQPAMISKKHTITEPDFQKQRNKTVSTTPDVIQTVPNQRGGRSSRHHMLDMSMGIDKQTHTVSKPQIPLEAVSPIRKFYTSNNITDIQNNFTSPSQILQQQPQKRKSQIVYSIPSVKSPGNITNNNISISNRQSTNIVSSSTTFINSGSCRLCGYDSKNRNEVIIEKPVFIEKEKIVEVPREVIVEKRVEVPKEVIVEKRVEVPREVIVEKRVEVPREVIVEKRVEVPREVIVEKRVEVPKEVIVEKRVEVIVEKRVEIPGKETFIEKIVYEEDKESILKSWIYSEYLKMVLEQRNQTINQQELIIFDLQNRPQESKIVEVIKEVEIPIYVEKPVIQTTQVIMEVEKVIQVQDDILIKQLQDHIRDLEEQLEQHQESQKHFKKQLNKPPVEKIVEVEKIVQVENFEQIRILEEDIRNLHLTIQQLEKRPPMEIEKIIEIPKYIEKIREVEVEKIVQVENQEEIYIFQHIIDELKQQIYVLEQKPPVEIEKIVEIPKYIEKQVEVEKIVEIENVQEIERLQLIINNMKQTIVLLENRPPQEIEKIVEKETIVEVENKQKIFEMQTVLSVFKEKCDTEHIPYIQKLEEDIENLRMELKTTVESYEQRILELYIRVEKAENREAIIRDECLEEILVLKVEIDRLQDCIQQLKQENQELLTQINIFSSAKPQEIIKYVDKIIEIPVEKTVEKIQYVQDTILAQQWEEKYLYVSSQYVLVCQEFERFRQEQEQQIQFEPEVIIQQVVEEPIIIETQKNQHAHIHENNNANMFFSPLSTASQAQKQINRSVYNTTLSNRSHHIRNTSNNINNNTNSNSMQKSSNNIRY